ncbi:MAG: hypothetical protein QM533_05240 [Cytophagales bacterium]|nr:hypothetical protein [Cytophagales bacterium]
MHIFERLVVRSWLKHRNPQKISSFARYLPSLPSSLAKELIRLMRSYDQAAQTNGTFYAPSSRLKRSFSAMLVWGAFRVAREKPALFVFGVLGLLPALVMVLIHLGRRFAELLGLL